MVQGETSVGASRRSTEVIASPIYFFKMLAFLPRNDKRSDDESKDLR